MVMLGCRQQCCESGRNIDTHWDRDDHQISSNNKKKGRVQADV